MKEVCLDLKAVGVKPADLALYAQGEKHCCEKMERKFIARKRGGKMDSSLEENGSPRKMKKKILASFIGIPTTLWSMQKWGVTRGGLSTEEGKYNEGISGRRLFA